MAVWKKCRCVAGLIRRLKLITTGTAAFCPACCGSCWQRREQWERRPPARRDVIAETSRAKGRRSKNETANQTRIFARLGCGKESLESSVDGRRKSTRLSRLA